MEEEVLGKAYDGRMICRLLRYVSNRIATVTGGPTYSYDAKNKRISTLHADGTEELFFYGPNGRKLSTIHLSPYTDSGPTNNIIYFAGRIVGNSSGALIQDRRGSIGAYDPWGEDPNNTGNDTEKFATYTRDNATGLDYADQRYYSSQFGRFISADPYAASGGQSDPTSWNRYLYTRNDPVNRVDRSGLQDTNTSVEVNETYLPVFFASAQFDGPTFFEQSSKKELSQAGARAAANAYSQKGLDVGRSALLGLSGAALDSEECQKDLSAIGVASGLSINADSIHATAAAVYDKGHLFDGASSPTVINGVSVSELFENNALLTDPNGRISGFAPPGTSIFIRSSYYATYDLGGGKIAAQAYGSLLHEVIHLLGAEDKALNKALYGGGNSEGSAAYSTRLAKDCF